MIHKIEKWRPVSKHASLGAPGDSAKGELENVFCGFLSAHNFYLTFGHSIDRLRISQDHI